MDLKAELLREHSKAQALKIVDFIGNDPSRFDLLMRLFFTPNYRINQRAAWPMSICVERHPSLIIPYLDKLVQLLDTKTHVALKRNAVRALQYIDIPDSLLGLAADNCFNLLASSSEAIAVKVFSMTILANICEKEPELKWELIDMIENQLAYSSAGFKSRAAKILKKLKD